MSFTIRLLALCIEDERIGNLKNRFDLIENNLDVKFESLKMKLDEISSKSLDNLNKFEVFLIQKKSKRFKYENDSIVGNRVLNVNLKNFPFKSFNLINQYHVGTTDLITIDSDLTNFEKNPF